jgi:transcriptional regulator with XRE-family HTH domain
MAKNTPTLKELRMALGLTQKEAAAIAGVTPKTLGGWERGENISRKNLVKAALAYQCNSAEIQLCWAKSKSSISRAKKKVRRIKKKLKTAC